MHQSHRQPWFAIGSLCVAFWLGATAQAQAQQGAKPSGIPVAGQDQHFIIGRQVNPRIAYRPVPREDLPVRVQATVFPGRTFHSTLGSSLALGQGGGTQGVDDAVLGQTRSVNGWADGSPAMASALAPGQVVPGAWQSSGAMPLGMNATGAGGATRGLGAGIGASVNSALQGLNGGGR